MEVKQEQQNLQKAIVRDFVACKFCLEKITRQSVKRTNMNGIIFFLKDKKTKWGLRFIFNTPIENLSYSKKIAWTCNNIISYQNLIIYIKKIL